MGYAGRSIYFRPMPTNPGAAARRLDAVAVDAALARMAKQAVPPWLHGEVARRMAERLALIRQQPARIVEWWAFLGASAGLLRKAYPKASRVMVEPTPRLAERSREMHRPGWWSPRRITSDHVSVCAQEQVDVAGADLLWANMMLHAVDDPPALMSRWQQALDTQGFVMFSCFGPDTLRELRDLYARLGWGAPMAPFVDMHDLGDMLVHAGFADPVMDQETLTLHWPDASSLLRELRSLGGNVASERFAGWRTPRWRKKLERELGLLAQRDGRLAMRFEIVYGHAFKAPTRAPSQETTVPLDEMRTLVRSRRNGP